MLEDGPDSERHRPAKYPAIDREPRQFRSRKANRTAALLALGGLVLAIVALALFAS